MKFKKVLITLACFMCSSAFSNMSKNLRTKQNINIYKKPEKIPYPSSNKYSKHKDELGKILFFDPRISGSKWISCNTCHNAGLGWEDGLAKGLGHGMKKLGRHTPTILNLAWGELFFWDGRADSLEKQALGPIESTGEMNMNLDDMLVSLKNISGYKTLFKNAFPGEKQPISKKNVAKALATFERGIVSNDAPFDKWLKGDNKAMSKQALLGFKLFNGKANCAVCHEGWRFTDDGFHNIGVDSDDVGRYKEIKVDALKFAFKTPTLRNIDQRAPYMHDGSVKTLKELVEFYNKGGVRNAKSKSEEVRKLNLNKNEVNAVVEFLHALTSVDDKIIYPVLPN